MWDDFGKGNRPPSSSTAGGSLAANVCATFGLVCETPSIGGSLDGIDIKQMDAMSVIRLSLLEEASSGELYEPIINNHGHIEFKKMKSGSPSLDVYYTIQTFSYKEYVSGVMVTGKKPLTYRRPASFQDFFRAAGGKRIWDLFDVIDSCVNVDFSQIRIITYNDLHLSSSYNDGISNFYDVNTGNPYDRILGYAYKIIPPSFADRADVSITIETSCEVPLAFGQQIGAPYPRIGTLEPRRDIAQGDEGCWTDRGYGASGGIKIEIPSEVRYSTTRGVAIDKLLGVSGVYVIGIQATNCAGIPINNSAASMGENTTENTELWLSVNNVELVAIKLDEGIHYVINYSGSPEAKDVKIVFANNARFGDMANFGDNTQFFVLPSCRMASSWGSIDFPKLSNSKGKISGKATILPVSNTSALIVSDIIVMLSLSSPCVKIVDPQGHAKEIAEGLQIEVAAIVSVDEPAPVAMNGGLIDLVSGIVDHDPTTTQNIQNTPLESALETMGAGSGLSLNCSFLDAGGCAALSSVLYNYLKENDGVETTYICGPDTEVELGDEGSAGGVVNSISYSYSDSGAYTISVNEGPLIVGGFDGISGGTYVKLVESFSAEGTILQDAGNHVDYKVRVDGFGDVYAINCTPTVIRVGDRVSVSINNNPVEN